MLCSNEEDRITFIKLLICESVRISILLSQTTGRKIAFAGLLEHHP